MQRASKQRSTHRVHVSELSGGAFPAVDESQENGSSELPELLDYHDLARITGESVITHRRRKMLGTGPRALRIGRHIRFHPKDVSEWLERCVQSGQGV